MSESRGRAYTRYQRNSHINRKKRIIHELIFSVKKAVCTCKYKRL